jgi:hypothetical protein
MMMVFLVVAALVMALAVVQMLGTPRRSEARAYIRIDRRSRRTRR